MLSERLRFRDIRRTSTFRLMLAFSIVFTIGIVALLGLAYGLTARELTSRSDDILRREATRLLAAAPDQLPALIREEVARSTSGLDYFALTSGTGETIVGNIAFRGPLSDGHPSDVEASPRHGPLRLLAVHTAAGETILIGRDISQIRDLRRRILLILLLAGVAIIPGMALATVALSLRPLRRVRDLQVASRQIAAGQLAVRMPIAGRHDELDQFAATVNVMVEDVGRVVAQVKGITDAVAHDLRTPLTRVRTHLSRAQRLPDVPPAFAALAEKAVADLDTVLERFAALLRISEIEASARRSGFRRVALAPLVESIIELYDPLAEENAVVLSIGRIDPADVDADEKLLFEAISNLVDNAIKFAGGRVAISVRRLPGSTIVEVADDGPGIAPADREAVLRRFHRGADAASIPGSGLGLSVVAAIMHLHGFALGFGDARPGLIATVTILD